MSLYCILTFYFTIYPLSNCTHRINFMYHCALSLIFPFKNLNIQMRKSNSNIISLRRGIALQEDLNSIFWLPKGVLEVSLKTSTNILSIMSDSNWNETAKFLLHLWFTTFAVKLLDMSHKTWTMLFLHMHAVKLSNRSWSRWWQQKIINLSWLSKERNRLWDGLVGFQLVKLNVSISDYLIKAGNLRNVIQHLPVPGCILKA